MSNLCGNCFCESLNDRGICTRCGFRGWENKEKYPLALPAGSILNGRYIIGRVLGQGGFGITYTARDHQTGQIVAIKEFFPDSMVTRSNHTAVMPYTGERGENFGYGKDTFLLEAKTMAEFIGCPNIVRVYSYFEENGTGYFVMEYVDGQSFQSYLKENFGRIPWEDALRILLPVMDALSIVHEKGIIHRDIAPDNICIAKDGTVKLLDFGAARYSLGNVSQSLDVVLRHGFAPREQYKRRGRQGPYTDVYALGATLYYALTGVRPDDALERQDEDNMPLPSSLGANVTEAQEDVILTAMAVDPEDRYQSMADFKAALLHSASVKKEAPKKTESPREKTVKKGIPRQEPVKPETPPKQKRKGLPRWVTPAIAAFLLVMGLGTELTENEGRKPSKEDKPAQSVSVRQTEPEQEPENRPDTALRLPETEGAVFEMAAFPEAPEDVAYSERGNTPFWGQERYVRNDVQTLSFRSSLAGMPGDAWDISGAQDGSVMAWMQDGDLTVAANGTIALPANCSSLFFHFEEMTALDFGGCVTTSRVTLMENMFEGCRNLIELDVSFFDTSHVTSTNEMFYGCHDLTALDVSGFDTSNMDNIRYMFYSCGSLTYLDVSGFDTSRVTNMSHLFGSCSNLANVDVSGFDTSLVTDMSGMFWCCYDLQKVDVSGFDTSNVTNMNRMFISCKGLSSLDVSNFVTNQVTDMGHMFDGCAGLTRLDLSGFNTSNVKDMRNMFDECINLADLDLSSFCADQAEHTEDMFLACGKLKNLRCSDKTILSRYKNR